jgi:DNA polymerase-3 subunit delta
MAARILNYLEQNARKNPVIPIVAFLFSFFSKLLVASQLQSKDENSLVSALKISPYASRDYSSALQAYSTQSILHAIHNLQQADLKLKGVDSSSASEGQLLRETVFRILA